MMLGPYWFWLMTAEEERCKEWRLIPGTQKHRVELSASLGLDPFILFLFFKFKFKFIDFEKTIFNFIDFEKNKFKFISEL